MSWTTTTMTTTMMMPPPSAAAARSAPPTRPIPGSYGPPVVGPLKDRLDYFWFQGPEAFFRSRIESHKSTVFRANMPPTFPFFVGVDPRVICLLDCASFSSLFDLSVVEKRDVLIGDYMPSLRFTGNTRVAVYQDPSEPQHARVKNFCLDLLKRSAGTWASEFLAGLDTMLSAVEAEVSEKGSSNFILPLQKCIFRFLCKSIVGADPSASPDVGDQGFVMLDKWLALQLLPTVKLGVIPQPLEELLAHSFPLPFFLVAGDYRKLYAFVAEQGHDVIELARTEYGLTEEDAVHNILFVLGFNAFGGFSVFLPSLVAAVGAGGRAGLRDRLKEEVRGVLDGGPSKELGFAAAREMGLVRSTVYEVLRTKPPVPLQYARAKADFSLASHEWSYPVRKGELLCGYQPLAMRDPTVFEDPDEFVADRFKDDEGLLRYLFWSNGPETGTPSTENKQCAAKDHVVATACLMVAHIFDRYDVFECDDSSGAIVKLVRREKAEDEAGSRSRTTSSIING
ncbi:putative inactive linolenate hydroperoxide lyase [Iris pallida]|uniref:Inactive linolenate hydroperoxide lyase n=1 Tax=Iris pallida TaxID=29817 RepID=A0AAX6FU95_IRIPA|nr:putative inactive linolenate hydroperoxide lyase [Iris pallida]